MPFSPSSTLMLPTVILYAFGLFVSLGFGVVAFRDLWNVPTKERRWAIILILLGLLLRLGWIAYTQPNPVSDYLGYWQDGLNFLTGNFAFDRVDKHPGISLQIYYVIALFGVSYWPVWGLNLLWSVLVLTLTFLLARQIFGYRPAILALALAVVEPQLIAYSALFASELPTLYFYLLMPWAMLRQTASDSEQPFISSGRLKPWLWSAGLGFCLYTAILTRSTSLVFVGVLGLFWLIFQRTRRHFIRYVLMVTVTFVLLGSWLWHQTMLAGKPGLFWGSEIWLVSTTRYETQGRLYAPHKIPALQAEFRKAPPGLTPTQTTLWEFARMKDYAQAIIDKDPLYYLAQGQVRLKHILWTSSETGIRDTQFGSDVLLHHWPPKKVTLLATISKHFWRVLLVMSVFGWLALFWPPRPQTRQGLMVIGVFGLVWLSFHYLMAVASDRWAVQIIPYVVILSAGGAGCFVVGLFPLSRLGRGSGRSPR